MENNKKHSDLVASYYSSGTLTINGKSYHTKQIKNKNGNITYTSITPKIFGIF